MPAIRTLTAVTRLVFVDGHNKLVARFGRS